MDLATEINNIYEKCEVLLKVTSHFYFVFKFSKNFKIFLSLFSSHSHAIFPNTNNNL
ncbi:hypothetical protein LBGG_00649 [Lactobacillus gasseri MV-22]|nr:hypothetical protein LBGG_00649 [Lactobacillus gasseri MV-22]